MEVGKWDLPGIQWRTVTFTSARPDGWLLRSSRIARFWFEPPRIGIVSANKELSVGLMEVFDVIIVGTGGVGSATLYQLAKRGVRVLGLDQFPQAHHHGSSHGQTRIIRQAYFEHADYVPLLFRTYELWDDLERDSGTKLFHRVGLLEVGPSDGILIPGVMRSVRQHNLPVESLTPAEACERSPFLIPDDQQAVFEPTAGYLLVEQCVETHLKLAELAGATWRQQGVVGWSAKQNNVTVETATESYSAEQLVICGGAWSTELLTTLGIPMRVVAKQQYWFTPDSSAGDATNWPTYLFESPHGYYYGFPAITSRGAKIARHSGGTKWRKPRSLEDVRDYEDESMVRQFLAETLPSAKDLAFTQQACMYTFSPDEHFIVDHHAEYENVCFAAGLSGHGFKFTPVLGEILSDLALGNQSDLPIEFLKMRRFK